MKSKRLFRPVNDSLNTVNHGPQCEADSSKRVDRQTLVDYYLEGWMEIHVHLGWGVERDAGDLCAIFKPSNLESRHFADHTIPRDRRGLNEAAGHSNILVFVSVVEILKPPQGVTASEILSTVRLRFLNDCLCEKGQSANTPFPTSVKLGGGQGDEDT